MGLSAGMACEPGKNLGHAVGDFCHVDVALAVADPQLRLPGGKRVMCQDLQILEVAIVEDGHDGLAFGGADLNLEHRAAFEGGKICHMFSDQPGESGFGDLWQNRHDRLFDNRGNLRKNGDLGLVIGKGNVAKILAKFCRNSL
jgi:hypothetical protein